MSRWDDLSRFERADLMRVFSANGIDNIDEMRSIYDDMNDTDTYNSGGSSGRRDDVLSIVSSSGADFVSRLKDANRKTISDWNGGKQVSHKLAYGGGNNKWYVYPMVQSIDGGLYDFSDPQYGVDSESALDSALYSGDYVEVPSESDARWFVDNYMDYYPSSNVYSDGGDKSDDIYGGEIDASVSRAGMSRREVRKASRPVRSILKELSGDNWSDTQKKRMVEYLMRVNDGKSMPGLGTVLDARRGLKYRDKDGVSGYERIMFGDEPVRSVINSENKEGEYIDEYGNTVNTFNIPNYDGTIHVDRDPNRTDIIDAYMSGSTPWDGVKVSGKDKYGLYGDYVSKNYGDRNVSVYRYGKSSLPKRVTDRLDRYSSEKGDNSVIIGASTDRKVPFEINNGDYGVSVDAAGHLWQFIQDDDGKIYRRQSDIYDFEPNQYNRTYGKVLGSSKLLDILDKSGDPVVMFNPWEPATTDDLYRLSGRRKKFDKVDMDSVRKARDISASKDKPITRGWQQFTTGGMNTIINMGR